MIERRVESINKSRVLLARQRPTLSSYSNYRNKYFLNWVALSSDSNCKVFDGNLSCSKLSRHIMGDLSHWFCTCELSNNASSQLPKKNEEWNPSNSLHRSEIEESLRKFTTHWYTFSIPLSSTREINSSIIESTKIPNIYSKSRERIQYFRHIENWFLKNELSRSSRILSRTQLYLYLNLSQ